MSENNDKLSMKQKLCCACGWKGFQDEVLEGRNPFDVTQLISGCPNCKQIEKFKSACDEPGCWDEDSCGTPTPFGYRRTCGRHLPRTFEIPSRQERHCEPCEHHKCVTAFYGSDHSWREYVCKHPEAFDDDKIGPFADPEKEKIRQRLIGSMLEHGRIIGRTERQPEWCPLRRPPETVQKPTKPKG